MRMTDIKRLLSFTGIERRYDVKLSTFTTARTGGVCNVLYYPKTLDELETLTLAMNTDKKKYLLGRGSNVLASDDGVNIAVTTLKFNKITVQGERVTAEAGALIKNVAETAKKRGLSGLEALSGIPGTVGGAIVTNAGAFGVEMSDVVESITVLKCGKIKHISLKNINFGYRTSVVKNSENMVVVEVVFRLKGEKPNVIEQKMQDYREKRLETQPSEASAGSVFLKTDDGIPAAKLIESAGLKGLCLNGAKVSEKHCNFIVNISRATTKDFVNLIDIIRQKVYNQYMTVLKTEIVCFGEENEDSRRLSYAYDLQPRQRLRI